MGEEILRMENITKIYPNGVMANKDVTLSVQKGEIHALMGENGAGKSTLMKILFGFESKDSGEIYFEGKKLETSSPAETIKQGIGMVIKNFEKLLEGEHVTPIVPIGEPFDAARCEAILAVEPKEGEESGIVKEVYAKGYEQNGKILRFAQVLVTK